MLKIFKQLKQPQPAFSLIEIMAVLLIVALGIVGTANLAVQSIQAQTINRGSIVAYQLAQEGIELVRQIRDTNWMQGNDWSDGLASGTYCVDYTSPTLRAVTGPNECELYFDADNWYFAPAIVSTGMRFSNFRRAIVIDMASSSASVRSVVTWDDRDKVFRYETETELYDWR